MNLCLTVVVVLSLPPMLCQATRTLNRLLLVEGMLFPIHKLYRI